MKYIMKKFFTVIMMVFALSMVMSSCVKDKMFVGDPSISSIAINPTSVDPGATVTVSATVYDLNGISSAVLTYTLNGAAGGSVNMTSSGDTYSAVIPGQVLKTVVAYTITATSKAGRSATSAAASYTVGADFGNVKDIRLNELNSATKFIEIYNPTDKSIDISGIKFAKNAADAYFSDANGTVVVAEGTVLGPKKFAVLGCKGSDPATIAPTALNLGKSTTGLSGSKSILVILQDKNGNTIDSFVNSALAAPTVSSAWDGAVEFSFVSAARIPDGTGDFYSTSTETPGVTNGTTTTTDKFTHKLTQ